MFGTPDVPGAGRTRPGPGTSPRRARPSRVLRGAPPRSRRPEPVLDVGHHQAGRPDPRCRATSCTRSSTSSPAKSSAGAIAERESAKVARRLITETCRREGVDRDQLTIHADRGGPMIAGTVAELLNDLGVTKSHSRPRVSNDNPFIEAHFKTLKYRPDYPDRFASIADARTWCRRFFHWYNEVHYHSGIGYLRPADLHAGNHTDHRRPPPGRPRRRPRRPPRTVHRPAHASEDPDQGLDQPTNHPNILEIRQSPIDRFRHRRQRR